jgi:transcriptional regulator with XRE-family HTH domain
VELSERIIRWRESRGLSQAALADKIGVSPSAVAQWELGQTSPSTRHLEKMAEVIGVTMERFYGRAPKLRAA